ncbi:MAG: RsmB/NOP family class I SAM-dependent RNA methyltransferase [Alphaproteobacteria bacterium]|nr:RsmB/NOP family class I SAM-dependent RNA methyltransferase [Alphaproteobacteria bacterium]
MKPSARIQACIDILEAVHRSRIPMDGTVGDYMRGRRYIGSKDRAAIVEKVYSIVRHFARLGWHLARTGASDTPRNFVIAYLALYEDMWEQRIADLFDGDKFAPEKLTEDERTLIKNLLSEKDAIPPETVRVECPPEHEQKLRAYFGKDFAAEMEAMIPPAVLDLRVNTFLIEREKAKASLKKDGVETTDTPYSPWGLRADKKVFLSKTKAFMKGFVDIQDEGSQLIAYVCGAKPGLQVLDYCAGGGGKTLALASAMLRKGRIVAMDTDERRLDKGRERFKKAQVSDIIEVRPLSDEKHRKWLRRQKETFDIVLLDVPCTGTGTWRRNPDLRWRTYGPGLEELVKVQAEILEKTAPFVKKGGKLVYATCSLLPDENEDQVAAFLAKHPEFEAQNICVPCESRDHSDPDKDSRFRGKRIEGKFLRLTPHRHQTDGFFAAVLKKNQ